MKWRLVFFVTQPGPRYGVTGLIGGDFEKIKDGTPEHMYASQDHAQRNAEMLNKLNKSFMCWPVAVEDVRPWNPVSV